MSFESQRAQEHDRGRHATQPLQIPRKGWYDILWRTYQEMQQDRLLSIAGGVSFFVLLAIFPAITALVSAYGLFFNPARIANDIGQLRDLVPANVLTIVHEQEHALPPTTIRHYPCNRPSASGSRFWMPTSGVKAAIYALNVIYEQREEKLH